MDGVVFKCTEPLTPRCLSVPSHNLSISAATGKWMHLSKKSLHPVLILKNCQPLGGKDLGSFSKGTWQGSMDTFTFYSLCFSKTRNEYGMYLTLKCTSMDAAQEGCEKQPDEALARCSREEKLLLPPLLRSHLTWFECTGVKHRLQTAGS